MSKEEIRAEYEAWFRAEYGRGAMPSHTTEGFSQHDFAWAAYQSAHASQQAIIDRLMLEYCPNEMTPEQVEEWGRNQQAVDLPLLDHSCHDGCTVAGCVNSRLREQIAEHLEEIAALKDVIKHGDEQALRDMALAGEERDQLREQVKNLLDAAAPFANVVKSTSGRIATERLAFADWNRLVKAFTATEPKP